MKSNKLEIVIEQSGLEQTKAKTVLDSFSQFFKQAEEWEIKAKSIVVTNTLQVEEMRQAREARLALKDIRVNAEKTRKGLKKQSLREGKAIDGIANVIKAIVEPLEQYLEKQEKFAELQIAKELDERNNKRILKLTPFVQDVTMYQLREMSDEAYNILLKSLETTYNTEREAEEKAERERVEKEKADKLERRKMEEENKKLKEEAILKEEEYKKQRKVDELKRKKEREERIANEKEKEEKRLSLEEELKRQTIKISKDGDKYCVLYGENIQVGIVGFGDTVENAITEFCKNWLKIKKE